MIRSTPMRGGMFALGLCVVGVAFACGSSIDTTPAPDDPDAATPADAATKDAASGTTETGAEAGSDSSNANGACVTSRECASGQCLPDPDGATNDAGLAVGQCMYKADCVYIPPGGKAPPVDDHCVDVVPCLGFTCVPTGIVAAPTGIFACGIPGDACANTDGQRCCYSECTGGKCAARQ